MAAKPLLIEIGMEELPPKHLKPLMDALGLEIATQLEALQLPFQDIETFSTPRRLAVRVNGLASQQADQNIERKGPSHSAAYDSQGKPSKALLGFAKSCGIDELSALQTLETKKGSWVVYRSSKPGKSLKDLIETILHQSIAKLPIAKKMRWGFSRDEFVRPVRWLLILHGSTILASTLFGKKSDRVTSGHRYMGRKQRAIDHAQNYEAVLGEEKVVVSFDQRRNQIIAQLELAAADLDGIVTRDEDLLDEVTALVEWPVVLSGSFSTSFLNVPEEALISAMREHQRYFHIRNSKGVLLPHFLTVTNIEGDHSQTIVKGNERVIAPRLADAAFFYSKDVATSSDARLQKLGKVVFQHQLGSFLDKANRISTLAGFIAAAINVDPEPARRAGLLAKTDLVSHMVGEFPDLQGIMGGYYADKSGEPSVVVGAIGQHYQPSFSGDKLPDSDTACCVALADKLDTLVGLFSIGQPPTGSKDPFGLRRQALGIVRICIEKQLPLDLVTIAEYSSSLFSHRSDSHTLLEYIRDRFEQWLVDQGKPLDVIRAIRHRSGNIHNLLSATADIEALIAFRSRPEAVQLILAQKRIQKILDKSTLNSQNPVNKALFQHPSEHELYTEILNLQEIETKDFDFSQHLTKLAGSSNSLQTYFENVMIMDENLELRQNRQAMLNLLRKMVMNMADLSLLQG
jgi:glycyl-tRNA synthetase beta chain